MVSVSMARLRRVASHLVAGIGAGHMHETTVCSPLSESGVEQISGQTSVPACRRDPYVCTYVHGVLIARLGTSSRRNARKWTLTTEALNETSLARRRYRACPPPRPRHLRLASQHGTN